MNEVPKDALEFPGFDLNEAPDNPLDLDLNERADMQEMIIDPVVEGPQPQEMFLELNDLLNQVNEKEEDAQVQENEVVAVQNELAALANNQAGEEINFPAFHAPMMPLEMQEDELMNDAEIQQQLQEEHPRRMLLGLKICRWVMFLLKTTHLKACLFFEKSPFYDEPFGPWAKFFAPTVSAIVPQILVPKDWAKFFTSLLLSPEHFGCAKELLQSKTFLSCIGSENGDKGIGFILPKQCPLKVAPKCNLLDAEQEVSDIVASEAPPVEKEITVRKKKGRKDPVLVESDVRRSP